MIPALFIAYARAERSFLAMRVLSEAWARWQLEAASQIFQCDIDPVSGRPIPPCRGLGGCMGER
jgi:hypothetical protein